MRERTGVERLSNGSVQKGSSCDGDSSNGSVGGFGLPTVLSAESPWRKWLQQQESLPNQASGPDTSHEADTAVVPGTSRATQSNSAVGAVQSDSGCSEAVGISMGGEVADIDVRRPKTKYAWTNVPGPVGEGIEDAYYAPTVSQPMETPTGMILARHLEVLLHAAVLWAVLSNPT